MSLVPETPPQGDVHTDQMPEPPQLAPLNTEEQRLDSELLPLCLRLRRKLISTACICVVILSDTIQELMTIGESWNID